MAKEDKPSFEPIKGASMPENAKIASDEFDALPDEVRQPILRWAAKWFRHTGYRRIGQIISDRWDYDEDVARTK